MVYSNVSLFTKIYHVTRRTNLYGLSVILARMFSVDVYWTHLLIVPLFWGIFMPVLTYKVTKFVFKGEAVPLLSAALLSCTIPNLIATGTSTIAYSLGVVFILLVICLSLSYLRFKRGLLLSIVVAFSSFLAHEQIGLLSVCVILVVYTYAMISETRLKNVQRAFLLFAAFVIAVLLIPCALLAFGFIRGGSAPVPSFSLKPFEELSTYEAVFLFIFGEYADMTFRDVFISWIIPLLGLLGLVYTFLKGGEGKQSRKASIFMLLCFIFVMIDYRILKLFSVNVPFSIERMWDFRDLLAVPFATITIVAAMNFAIHKLASETNEKTSSNTTISRKTLKGSSLSINLRKIAVVTIVILSLSSLATSAVYTAYPQWTEAWWTTAHELEAARYIEENTPRNETYVVLCDVHARLAGYAVVGPENPRAYYYGPYESRLLKPLYNEMMENPSMGPVLAVREKNDASTVYVMINTIRKEVTDADKVISHMMNLPQFELFGVFGEDVYVFKVRPPPERLVSGIGPVVFLYSNQTHLNTSLTLDVVTYEADYTLSLTGLTSYKITSWPMHWSFESITPPPYSKNVDADNWVNFTGREDVTYTVLWRTNLVYQPVVWKDDSFKIDKDWRVHVAFHWEQLPQLSTDGDILNMTGVFREGVREGYRIIKDVANISTNDYPYVIVKWRSTGTCAIVAVRYDNATSFVLKPDAWYPYSQHSPDWKVSVLKLPEGKLINGVVLALDDSPVWNDIEGIHSVYYDYVMFSNMTTPQF